ncbi:MAG: serine/threonine-protein phosphatase [Lachnospiraceae bacterium]|nr:serine/threonine-protein phosphatase [Lachnospiraceae bacterium]
MNTQMIRNKSVGLQPAFCMESLQGSRERQEDYGISRQTADRTIAVVCDGMGGMREGNTASRFAAEQMLAALEQAELTEHMHVFWKKEMERLDDAVYGLRYADGARMRAGTTMVAVVLQGNKLHWFSIGDSKLFYMRKHKLHCVTREHNYALLAEKISGESGEVYVDPKAEQLISYLGMGTAALFDGSDKSFETERGDKLLLCTDGLYRTVPQEEIAEILDSTKEVEVISNKLRGAVLAKKYSNQDNATWVVMGR